MAQAVVEMQSLSAELQATATQQALGAREQSSAMSEVTTTMTELLTTSRQIAQIAQSAQSAQQVANVSVETAKWARSGESMVRRARGSVGEIRGQVDGVVAHRLDVGLRSQEIGGVTEMINELAKLSGSLAALVQRRKVR